MFKAARYQLVSKRALTKEDVPSYFIECLLYNVPASLFAPKLAPTYLGILTWLKTAGLNGFQCQNGQLPLFGPQPEQWSVKKARRSSRHSKRCGTRGVERGSKCRPGLFPQPGHEGASSQDSQ